MKRITAIGISIFIILTSFLACSVEAGKSSDKLQIVSTIFPSYDFARQVCGNKADITMLLPPGSESHSFEPTPQDIITIQNCDLFIYVGGESDTWVDDILKSMDKPVKTLKMMDCVSVVEEELIEGMEAKEEHEDEETEYDEHVWTSLTNAIKITKKIAEAMISIDEKNSLLYNSNTEDYVKLLEKLDNDFSDFFSTIKNKTIIFGDRFPLRYFADEYGLEYYAAFPGCSCETEPSVNTVTFLIDKVKTEKVRTVFYIEFSNHKIADNIAEAAGVETALFETCHNVSKDALNNDVTYVSLMEKNLVTLKEAME